MEIVFYSFFCFVLLIVYNRTSKSVFGNLFINNEAFQ